MLPPGHIAAGYLTAYGLVKLIQPEIDPSAVRDMYLWGMFWGFAPDLDNFFAFWKMKSWWYKGGSDSGMHRKFYSHVPVLWLLAGVILYFLVSSAYWKMVVVLLVLGSFSHFVLDSIEFGVKWLWPFSDKLVALVNPGVKKDIQANGFFSYWLTFLSYYKSRPTFFLEIIILISAVLIFLYS